MDEDSGNCKMAGHVAEEGAGAPRSSMLYMVAAKARHLLASPGAAGTLIFASVFLVLAYRRKKRSSTAGPVDSKKTPTASQEVVRQQSRANPALYRSVSLAMLHGGEKAMQRLMDAHEACRDESRLSSALDDMRNELDKDRMDFNKLHAIIPRLEMSGKEKEAITILQEALKKAKTDQQTHKTYELEMLLVEMLIYEGEYDKALRQACLCSEDVSTADARVPLYQATVYAMKGETDRAKERYEKFKDIRKTYHGSKFDSTGSALHMTLPEFDRFEIVANNLKKTIWQAHQTKTIAQPPETKTADGRVDKETHHAQQQEKALANSGKK
ncbi:unnamed protein product [Musa acuminata subsp. malaccensis]|uniref:(wild Malaysian banana) hypothetical protein n=1 Tax=Musa acuminata subsp. malaccensis TaxID=214687 RepID=A0A804KQ26_MUSAM|nr:PREDICTED: uncharacterized protein LOC103999316 [Musa acuminata subsp. malaccensis]CAG1836843.1 unnamed protein product [Musa acuminata subsp. malaccensis]